MQDLSGRKFGQYELRERLGRGGMAEVYKAYQPGMDRFVAIKVMLGHLATDESFIERFRREAQAVGRLRHPHLVQIFDFGIEGDVYYMAMEFIQGGTLKDAIRQAGKLRPEYALRITSQLADALAYAHQNDMIHRDLKPA
ncbi:MAG: serine/threonine protein kinase, partial [Anaerolineae bacterium]|nr:serine/threonine protein kinase [Anaerolineae bacterium]